ncbi:uncharacterized protein LOC110244982 isoform X2 [Exaiptasia diaphana]|uniref:ShKT domain-containing protein n=1 Tax=Exaiptasia diaphana TaxID=2652724 RepID=A0A913XMX8_EXADI|nr:uncharacterized protein LOC110244982 isoform X2 [Exaiptasia diaphana]
MNSFSIKDILRDSHDFRTGLSYVDKTPRLRTMADSTLQHYSSQPSFKTQTNGCRNSFSDEICGKIINRRDCTRPYTRKGSFGRRHCRKLCNFCS